MKSAEIKLIGTVVGLAAVLWVAFQILGTVTFDDAGESGPVVAPTDVPAGEGFEELLVLIVERDGEDGWACLAGGERLTSSEALTAWLKAQGKVDGVMMVTRGVDDGKSIVEVQTACARAGVAKIERRTWEGLPPEDE